MILFIMMVILTSLSLQDWRTMRINTKMTIIFLIAGMLFFMINWYQVMTLNEIAFIIIFTVCLWGIPVFFGFGFGDFLVFAGIAGIIGTVDNLNLFYMILIPVWIVYTVVMVFHKSRYNEIKNWKQYLRIKYPFVPAIQISFAIFLIFGVFH